MLRHRLHSWHCFLRDIFGIKPPKTSKALASAEANIDHTSLKVRYQHIALADKSHSCVLYRIIGNDLPPRHESGQSLRNLKFILEHESPLDHCQKIFLVNRMVDLPRAQSCFVVVSSAFTRDRAYAVIQCALS